jgi:hypothetical protein
MEHTEDQRALSPDEIKFKDCMKTGDDFKKIEIYRLAKYWYKKANETGLQSELLATRLLEMDQKIKTEQKTFIILGFIATVVIIGIWLLSR